MNLVSLIITIYLLLPILEKTRFTLHYEVSLGFENQHKLVVTQ